MQTKICNTMSEMTHQALENWKRIGETNLKVWERLFHAQAELATAMVDLVTMNGEEISHTKDVKEIASLQTEVVQASSKLLLESAQSTASILSEASKDYSQLFGTVLKSGAELSKPANTSKAKKEAA